MLKKSAGLWAAYVCMTMLILVAWRWPGIARAASFTPYQCAQCNSWSGEVPYSFTTGNGADIAPHWQIGNSYGNATHHHRYFLASAYVSKVRFRLASLNTGGDFDDYLGFRQPGQTFVKKTFFAFGEWVEPPTSASSRIQKQPIELSFFSDASVFSTGFNVDKVQVCCAASPSPMNELHQLEAGTRYTGVLLAPNDVVFAKKAASPPGTRIHAILWGATGNDFDLYVKCGAPPTITDYDYVGYSGDSKEFIATWPPDVWPYPCQGQQWYFAVHAYSGSGQFSLVVSDSKWSSTPSQSGVATLRVGVNFQATGTQLTAYSTVVRDGIRRFFGATEGQVLASDCRIWNNTGSACQDCGGQKCDICFTQSAERSNNTGPMCKEANQVKINTDCWDDSHCIAHELGHYLTCIQDEYGPQDCTSTTTCEVYCGHSMMALTKESGQDNLCVKHTGVPGGFTDHLSDPEPGATTLPCPPGVVCTPSSWDFAVNNGRAFSEPESTPDNYDYVDHDFNSAIECYIQ